MKRFILLTLFLTGMAAAQSQETADSVGMPRYQYRLDSTTFLIGDQVLLTIQPSDRYPSLEDLTNNDVVALRQWVDSADGTLHTAITSFEEGEHWYRIGADSLLLTVRDVEGVDTTNTDIKDIAGIMRQPYTFGEIAKTVGCIVGILLLIAAAVFVILRLKHHKPIIAIPQAPPIPPHTRALDALEELRQQQLWQQGMPKEYHTRLTDILRAYLAERFQIQSAEMTTDQTLDAFRCCPAATKETADMLRHILQTADMVKFAKSEPLPYQHDQSMTLSVGFVNATMPQPPLQEANTDNATNNIDRQI